MKCNHCGKDIPQRLILADAARILAKKSDFESDNLTESISRLNEVISWIKEPIPEDLIIIHNELLEIRLLLLKGAKP